MRVTIRITNFLKWFPCFLALMLLCIFSCGQKNSAVSHLLGSRDVTPTPDAQPTPLVTQLPNALDRAQKMVALLGSAGPGTCSQCHGASLVSLKAWASSTSDVEYECLSDLTKDALSRINCLRSESGNVNSPFTSARLGFYSASANSEKFQKLFKEAYPNDSALENQKFQEFVNAVQMPPLDSKVEPIEEDLFSELREWALAGMPLVEAVLKPEADRPCQPEITVDLKNHLHHMATEGWSARNLESGMPMFGCKEGNNDALKCLEEYPEVSGTLGKKGFEQNLRSLSTFPVATFYWTRVSPDGRYVAFGAPGGVGKIVDLQAVKLGKSPSSVGVRAYYDPAFLPDNSGFSFAGSIRGGISLCRMSLLTDAFLGKLNLITFLEGRCQGAGSDTYETYGASLDGLKYQMLTGTYANADNGEYDISRPLPGSYDDLSILSVRNMRSDGNGYKVGEYVSGSVPGIGDIMMSPSTELISSRYGANGVQSGYLIHSVKTSFSDGNSSVKLTRWGEVCSTGGKATFSFDERFLTSHKYANPLKKEADATPPDASDIFVTDLLTGLEHQVTQVKPGQKALFPHFRSDGWLVFVLRDINTNKEELFATDAALRLASSLPLGL